MALTKAEMRQRVAEDLSLVMRGQATQTQDADRIDAAFDDVYQRLKNEGLAVWAATGSVPTLVEHYFSILMQDRLKDTYSVPDARYQRIVLQAGNDGALAIANIARVITPRYQSAEDPENY